MTDSIAEDLRRMEEAREVLEAEIEKKISEAWIIIPAGSPLYDRVVLTKDVRVTFRKSEGDICAEVEDLGIRFSSGYGSTFEAAIEDLKMEMGCQVRRLLAKHEETWAQKRLLDLSFSSL